MQCFRELAGRIGIVHKCAPHSHQPPRSRAVDRKNSQAGRDFGGVVSARVPSAALRPETAHAILAWQYGTRCGRATLGGLGRGTA